MADRAGTAIAGLTWAFLQAFLMIGAVFLGTMVPLEGNFETGGPGSLQPGVGQPLQRPISFSQGILPTWSLAVLLFGLSLFFGYVLADFAAAIGALILSQSAGFILDFAVLVLSPSPISLLSERLQAFFFFCFARIFPLGIRGMPFRCFRL